MKRGFRGRTFHGETATSAPFCSAIRLPQPTGLPWCASVDRLQATYRNGARGIRPHESASQTASWPVRGAGGVGMRRTEAVGAPEDRYFEAYTERSVEIFGSARLLADGMNLMRLESAAKRQRCAALNMVSVSQADLPTWTFCAERQSRASAAVRTRRWLARWPSARLRAPS